MQRSGISSSIRLVTSMEYKEFLEHKAQSIPCCGFSFQKQEMNRNLFDWQKDVVSWALKKRESGSF